MSKKTYDSKFSDKKVTAAQYISQMMCERKANKDKVKLDKSFWGKPEWKKFFLYQLTLANNLLKIYPEGAIIQVLSNPKYKWVWSLNTKQVLAEFEKIAKIEEKPVIEEVPVTKRIEEKKKTLFDIL